MGLTGTPLEGYVGNWVGGSSLLDLLSGYCILYCVNVLKVKKKRICGFVNVLSVKYRVLSPSLYGRRDREMSALGRPHLGPISGLEEAVRGRWLLRVAISPESGIRRGHIGECHGPGGAGWACCPTGVPLAWTSGLSHVMDSRRPAIPHPTPNTH